jgi:flagellar assembly factor FliW
MLPKGGRAPARATHDSLELGLARLPIVTGVASPICFPAGLPGFPGRRTFFVEPLEGTFLARLVSTAQDGPNFLVLVEPALFFPNLEPFELDEADRALVGASASEELSTWLILTIRPGAVTANLLGPVVLNHSTGLAVQAVRRDLSLPVAAPLPKQEQLCLS